MSANTENREILLELRGAVCACGGAKKRRQTFCRADYFRLPVGLRERLYTEGAGYFEAYREAIKFLNFPPPWAKKSGSQETRKPEPAAGKESYVGGWLL